MNATTLDPKHGIPMDQRPKGRVKRADDNSLPGASRADGIPSGAYIKGTVDGRPAYSNGYFVLLGTHKLVTSESTDMEARLGQAIAFVKGEPQAAVGYSECVYPLVWFADGGAINAGIYDHVLRVHPTATFSRQTGTPGRMNEFPYAVVVDGEVVGMSMPCRVAIVPANLRAMIDSATLRQLDRLAKGEAVKDQDKYEFLAKNTAKMLKSCEGNLHLYKTKKDRKDADKRIAEYKRDIKSYEERVRVAKETIATIEGYTKA